MGKIVKYCSSCDENFAAKFGFCPNCGAALQAFEMSPVSEVVVNETPTVEAKVTPEPPPPAIIAAPEPAAVTEPIVEEPVVEKAAETPAPVETPVVAVPVTTPVYNTW